MGDHIVTVMELTLYVIIIATLISILLAS